MKTNFVQDMSLRNIRGDFMKLISKFSFVRFGIFNVAFVQENMCTTKTRKARVPMQMWFLVELASLPLLL